MGPVRGASTHSRRETAPVRRGGGPGVSDHAQRPVAGLVVAGVGVDAGALLPPAHVSARSRVGRRALDVERPTAAEVREAALTLRESGSVRGERARRGDAQRRRAGWAVNGNDLTRAAMARGQVRTLLADGLAVDERIDDAIEDALAEHAQIDVLYDERARRAVDGLAALLRFRRA